MLVLKSMAVVWVITAAILFAASGKDRRRKVGLFIAFPVIALFYTALQFSIWLDDLIG